jgi:transcriptional antiterminator RfaH
MVLDPGGSRVGLEAPREMTHDQSTSVALPEPGEAGNACLDADDARAWYVARSQPHKERYAAAALEQRGLQVYLPILVKPRPRAGRRNWEPLFASYLFAKIQVPSPEWLSARASPGIAYFLGHAGRPSPLPSGFIPDMQVRLECINRTGGLPTFTHGQRVTIVEGAFAQYDAIFDRRLSPAGRARVLLTVLRRLVRLDLPQDWLRAAG